MARVIRSEAALAELLAKPGYRVREQFGSEVVSTSTPDAPATSSCGAATPLARASGTPIALPWPPTGNHAVKHTRNGGHYLQPEVIAYRDGVANLVARFAPITSKYRLHVHLSPPDARRRDADNALKSVLDALVRAGYLKDDSLTYMRELLVTTDDERRNGVIVHAYPL